MNTLGGEMASRQRRLAVGFNLHDIRGHGMKVWGTPAFGALIFTFAISFSTSLIAAPQTGIASVYGNGDGHAWSKTANGERVNFKGELLRVDRRLEMPGLFCPLDSTRQNSQPLSHGRGNGITNRPFAAIKLK